MEQQKDYSLLRPFDLDAAKRGEPICFKDDGQLATFLGESDQVENDICLRWEETFGSVESGKCAMLGRNLISMAPLCWVEGKPVYKGDVLYSKFFQGMPECADGIFEVTGFEDGQFRAGKLSDEHATKVWSCSWPKVEREVKLLAYLTGENLVWKRCGAEVPDFYIRVPSEDKVIEIEQPAELENGK